MIDKKREELQFQIIDVIKKSNYNSIVVVPTGVGKARILIECLRNLNPKGRIFYLCDSELNRDVTFKNELIKWGAEEWIDKIEFMCYQTAYKLEGEKVELCLADELDFVADQYVNGCLNNKFEHFIGVTATLTADKRRLVEQIRPVVFEIGLQEVEDKGLLNKTKYFEVNFMLTPKESLVYSGFNRTFASLLDSPKKNTQELEFLKIRRGHFLSKLDSSAQVCKRLVKELLKDEKSRLMIFCGLTEQAERVCENSYHSKSVNNMLTEFHEGKIRALSVVSKINRGANIGARGPETAINRMIFDSPTKSATKFLQRSGRGRRLSVGDVLEVYFLIPWFKNARGKIMPTIVQKWVRESTRSIEYIPVKYEFKST